MWTRRDEERMRTRRRRKEGRDTRRKERGPVILHTMSNMCVMTYILGLGLKLVLELELGLRRFVPLALCGGA